MATSGDATKRKESDDIDGKENGGSKKPKVEENKERGVQPLKTPAKAEGAKGEETTEKSKSKEKGEEEEGTMLEKGFIAFFYRPRVELPAAHDLADVQRLYLLLSPGVFDKHAMQGGQHKKRLIVVSRKKLPALPGEDTKRDRTPTWCFVEAVSNDMKKIEEALGPAEYETKTQGERKLEAARPVGEGVYGILDYANATHLSYSLELPKELGEAQEAFNIEKEGSYILSVKNPQRSTAAGLGRKEKAAFPPELESRFEGRAWTKVNPTTFLDVQGAELLLIGLHVRKEEEEELDDLASELRRVERLGQKQLQSNKLFQELKLTHSAKQHPTEPLTQGEWK